MTHTPTETLVLPGVYQFEQGASINDEQWFRFTDAVKEAPSGFFPLSSGLISSWVLT